MVNLIKYFFAWLASLGAKPAPAVTPAPEPVVVKPPKDSAATNQPAPKDIPPPAPTYAFDSPQNARHSVRVLCDEAGLPLTRSVEVEGRFYMPKDILCACIEQESGFKNSAFRHNYAKDGKTIASTDWGICQINDYYHIGRGMDFPSVEYVVDNPAEVVKWMIRMYKAGKLKLWVSYTSGAYIKYLPQN